MHPLHAEINALIDREVNRIRRAILELRLQDEKVTPSAVKDQLMPEPESRMNLIAYGHNYSEELRRQGKIPTSKRYASIMRKVERFAGGAVSFDEMTPSFLRDYIAHMRGELGNGKSTVASNLRALRSLYNRAVADGIVSRDNYPFENISVKEPPGKKRKLTAQEVGALTSLDLKEGSTLWHVRNYFLFSMYCAGVRFRDIADLRVEHVRGGRLYYRMSKTGGYKNVDLPPVALEIVEYYVTDWSGESARVFPILDGYDTSTPEKFDRSVQSRNSYTNKLLKELAEKAGIGPKLSFHMSRHSFASLALDAGWGVRKIQAALGHSDLETTERYLKQFDPDFIGAEMTKLFDRDE